MCPPLHILTPVNDVRKRLQFEGLVFNPDFNFLVFFSDCLVSGTPPNVVTAEVSPPAGVMATPDEPALALTEGIAKGGYPVDIAAQSTVDLTTIGQSELACTSALSDPALEPAAVAQMEIAVLDTQQSFTEEQEFPPSITEVIRPMEMAELVHILPTLSLIEEETPCDPTTPSVMEMLESFGLGIIENSTLFGLESSNLNSEAGYLSPLDMDSRSSSVRELQSQDTSSCPDAADNTAGGSVSVSGWNKEAVQAPIKTTAFPARNQVEWDRPCSSSS